MVKTRLSKLILINRKGQDTEKMWSTQRFRCISELLRKLLCRQECWTLRLIKLSAAQFPPCLETQYYFLKTLRLCAKISENKHPPSERNNRTPPWRATTILREHTAQLQPPSPCSCNHPPNLSFFHTRIFENAHYVCLVYQSAFLKH